MISIENIKDQSFLILPDDESPYDDDPHADGDTPTGLEIDGGLFDDTPDRK